MKFELILADRQVDKAVTVILRYALPDSYEANGHATLMDVSETLRISPPPWIGLLLQIGRRFQNDSSST